MKQDKAVVSPEKLSSIIVDSQDQSTFGLPHSVTKSKDDRGTAVKSRLIGLLENKKPANFYLYTMTVEHLRGANQIVETIHRIFFI